MTSPSQPDQPDQEPLPSAASSPVRGDVEPGPAAPPPGGAEPEPGTSEDPTAAEPATPEDPTAAEPDVAAGTEARRARRRQAERESNKRGWLSRLEIPILIVIAIAVAVLIKTFVIQPFYIPSESMEKTLHGCSGCSGDRILVFKPGYHFHDPAPGDIVVFRAPDDWHEEGGVSLSSNPIVHGLQWAGQLVGVVPPSEKDLVKRVIAVGGQTIKCCDAQGNVEVSDDGVHFRSLDEPYIYQNSSFTPANDRRSFPAVKVPSGRLWVMGDHRSDSADSLYQYRTLANGDPSASTVPVDDVIGKAIVIAWPPSRWTTLGTPATFQAAAGVAVTPGAVPLLGIAPIYLVRRRSRRRSRR